MIKFIALLLFFISVCRITSANSPIPEAVFTVPSVDVGTTTPLTGQWLFKPDNAVKEGAQPQNDTSVDGYNTVPVPQMLSRIQWWLDDSEDFKKWEEGRLKKLGFDTDKSDSGWYRAIINVPELPKDRHVWIEFDGVAMISKVFVNGKPLGEHKGMFSRFSYDLTEHLKPGQNTLAIWVSMEKIPKTDAQLGEAVTVNLSAAKVVSMSKGMFGPLTVNQDNRAYDLYGIWQPVKLVVRGPAKIEDVFFQPTLTNAQIDVAVRSSKSVNMARLSASLTDPITKAEFAVTDPIDIEIGLQPKTHQLSIAALTPKLWTPAEPNLYRLDVTISNGDKIVDQWSQNVGFRTFEIKDNQFLLNGKPYWLRGANQLPYGKNPWDAELPRKLIQMMHDANQRFTRTHATPWNENWLNAADEIGIAVSVEGIRPWAFAGKAAEGKPTVMPPPAIFQHWMMENEDVVKRCRNHPSVFIFTVGNEMLLRDNKNMEKWKLLSDVTKQTRTLAPGHPIVCSSDYVRDPEFYESTLKPAGIDDGDIDDLHRYNGWYADSPFVIDSKYEKEVKNAAGKRPIIGQEMSTGYPDLDTGLPVMRYTRDLVTPQAWVGVYAYPGNDPAIFLDEYAKVTKRWAEQLRFQRGKNTAGFSLFSAECWFRHSYLPEATPYSVLEAVKMALAPVGLALETSQRRFYAGDEIATNLYITNDDEKCRDFKDMTIQVGFVHSAGSAVNFIDAGPQAKLAKLAYYETAKVPLKIQVPKDLADARTSVGLVVRLVSGDQLISTTTDPVEIFAKPTSPPVIPDSVTIIQRGESLDGLKDGGELRMKIEAGGTAIVFCPSKNILKLFPDDLLDVKNETDKDIGEFADWYPARGTKLAENLKPIDLKWWARKNDWRVFVANGSHRLKPGGAARELIRFIPAHSYIAKEKVPDQYRAVMSEIPIGKGRLWICDLAIADSVDIDPAARLFADNLYKAAADPESTKTLLKVPSHEELLKGMK